MFCAISGNIPVEPVISPKTGYLYEKSLIESCIASEGKCPISGIELTSNDLISLKINTAVHPRTSPSGSIPGMLAAFQSEWDGLMLETFTLKKHLDSVRQELSQALYQYDASCRVIARLIKERDEARQALATMKANTGGDMEIVEDSVPKNILEEMSDLSRTLFNERKSRKISEEVVSEENIIKYKCQKHYCPHKSTKPGITCLDINKNDDNQIITGGIDHDVKIFNKSKGKVEATLSGHTKQINCVKFGLNGVILSGSADKTIRIWSPKEGNNYEPNILACHTDDVLSLSLHPLGTIFVSSSKDNTWCLNDISTLKCIHKFANEENNDFFTTTVFHPDGMLLAAGHPKGIINIWDMNKQNIAAKLEGHTSDITGVSFSENGYHMASSSLDGTVRIWDLRKLKNIHTLSGDGPVSCVAYDFSSKYLSFGGNDLRLYKTTDYSQIQIFEDASVTGICFSEDSHYIATTSMDRNLRFYF